MNIAFKEWALICDALGAGRQSIILRKGGIAEGRDGFRFKHEAFFLFPTFFHEQLVRTRHPEAPGLPEREEGRVSVNLFARVEWTRWVDDPAKAGALAPFHLWRDEVVRERFHYGDPPGLHVAALRLYRLAAPWTFPESPRYGGCRSWLQLPERPAPPEMTPVISDEAHARRLTDLRTVLDS